MAKLKNSSHICRNYSMTKAYQYMLHRYLHRQQEMELSNTTITSILYLLQSAGESLQSAQVSISQINECCYIHILVHTVLQL